MLLVDDLAAGGTKNLRHTPRGLVTLIMPCNKIDKLPVGLQIFGKRNGVHFNVAQNKGIS